MTIDRNKLMDMHRRAVELETEIRNVLLIDDVPLANGVTVELIQQVVAKSFRMPVSIMKEKHRAHVKAWPRMIAMALSRELTKEGVVRIGQQFGGRDHGTVCSAVRVVKDRCDTSREALMLVGELRGLLMKRGLQSEQ